MFCLRSIEVFVLIHALRSVNSEFSYHNHNVTYGCDNNYANLSLPPPLKSENVGALRLTTFKKLPNIYLRLIGSSSNDVTLVDQNVNLCFLENRKTNIFVKLFFDYFFGSIPGFKRFKCPFEAKVYEFPERSITTFANNASRYLPSFVRLQGLLKVTFEISSRFRGENIMMCKIDEIWTFKFD